MSPRRKSLDDDVLETRGKCQRGETEGAEIPCIKIRMLFSRVRLGGQKMVRGKHGISAGAVVHRHGGSFLASKHPGWPWAIYVHRTSTVDVARLKALPTGDEMTINHGRLLLNAPTFRGNFPRGQNRETIPATISRDSRESNSDHRSRTGSSGINIASSRAICPYSVNERGFIASLGTTTVFFTRRKTVRGRATTNNRGFRREITLRHHEIFDESD